MLSEPRKRYTHDGNPTHMSMINSVMDITFVLKK